MTDRTCRYRNPRTARRCHQPDKHDGPHMHFGHHFTEVWGMDLRGQRSAPTPPGGAA